jgi:hypothetical protein
MIIARLSYPKALACVACAILLAAFPWWAILAGWKDRNGVEALHDWGIWLLLFISPWMILASLVVIWFVLSRDSHAVRISDGLLSYYGDALRSIPDRFWLFFREGFSAFRRDNCIRSIPLADITSFSIGPVDTSGLRELVGLALVLAALFNHETTPTQAGGRAKGIFAHIKGGRAMHIPTGGMDAPRDVILARLNQALADSRR